MLKRFLIRLLVAAGFLLLFSLRFVDATIGDQAWEHPLEAGWKSTGLILEEVDTETWTKLTDRWLNVSELKTTARQIIDKLHLKLTTDWVAGIQDNYSYISFEGIRPDRTRVTVTIQSCRAPQQGETQMGIYTSRPNPSNNLRPYLENLKATLGSLAKNCNTSVFLTSKYKGELKREEVKELSRRIFRKLDAQLVEVDYQSPGNSIYKGYTPALLKNPQGVLRSNFEFSAKYDPQEKYTQVQLATPGSDSGV
ncbi:MAG TPA: YwmB family TATA-box binding protein [Bacillota bacterium]|nr:YwmB family TATA-box binding protein [Bacillota bacterium]